MHDTPSFLFITIQLCSFSLSCDILKISLIYVFPASNNSSCKLVKPSNKILSDDGKFTNITMIPNHEAIIIGSGTYRQTAPNAYTEHVEKSLHLLQLVGVDHIFVESAARIYFIHNACRAKPVRFFK